jgi:hypothetical protein
VQSEQEACGIVVAGFDPTVEVVLHVVPLMVCRFRFGLLPAISMTLVSPVIIRMPDTLDLPRWYADNVFLPWACSWR